MSQTKTNRRAFRNCGELLDQLGGIPPWRVCLNPLPGTATSRDLIRARGTYGGACEMIDRVIVEKPRDHLKAYLVAVLAGYLGKYLDGNNLGFLYGSGGWVRLARGVVRSPDLCFTPWSRMAEKRVPWAQIAKEVPELVIDLPTAANTRAELTRKLKDYFANGVRLVWVIHPRRFTAEVYTAPDRKHTIPESGTLDGGDVLPGFRLPLAKLFERLEKPKPKKRKK